MRKNTWVFYFFILLFTAILSINLVWRFTPIRSEISATIQEGLQPYLGKTFAMSDFSLGFGYMSFYNISAGNKDSNYILYLDEVQIGYSIHKLIFNKMDPLRVIESITFKNPKLILFTDKKDSLQDQSQETVDVTDILSGFKKLAEIDRIFIENGQIIWGKSPQDLTKLVSKLDGYLIINSALKAKLNLKGELFESTEKDLSLNGEIDLSNKKWEISAQIDNSQIKKSIPFLNSQNFSVEEAILSGNLQMVSDNLGIKDVNIKGIVDVQKMNSLLFGQKIYSDNFQIFFDNQKMILSPVDGKAEDGKFHLTGDFGTVFNPHLNLNVHLKDVSAKNLATSAPVLELLNQGKLSGDLIVNGPARDLFIEGKIYSPVVYYSIVPFYDADLVFTYQKKLWTFTDIHCHSIGLDHKGQGEIDFNSMKMKLNIYSQRHFRSDLFSIITKLNNSEMQYTTSIEGDFPTQTFQGNTKAYFQNKTESLMNVEANFNLIKDHITVQSTKSFPANFDLYADVTDLWNSPTFNMLELKNVPIDSLTQNKTVKWIFQKFRNDFYFSGPVNYPTTKVNFSDDKSKEILFSFVGSAINLIEPNFKFRGKFNFQTLPIPIQGNISLEDKKNEFSIQLDAPNMVDANLSILYDENQSIAGEVNFTKINIPKYLGRWSRLQQSVTEGDLSGKIKAGGSTSNPKITFNLQGENFIINENGYYSLNAIGNFHNFILDFSEAAINYNNRPIMQVNFTWNTQNNLLKSSWTGKEIETNFITSTIFKDPQLIKGEIEYKVDINGLFDRPNVSGHISMRKGLLKSRSFQNLNITFTDSIPPNATLFQVKKHIIKIPKLAYSDETGYSIDAFGVLPINPNSDMDIHINADGNVLAELPNLINYFQKPDCDGTLYLHLTGTRENPKLSAGKLEIYSGSLGFESVIPTVQNLQAEILLKENEQFISVKKIEGDLLGRHVKIYNTDQVTTPNQELKPWFFEDIGLNLGIFVLETDPKGIPLSIPGLMNPGDIGYFVANGKSENEKFYFAGPQEQPHVRGEVTLIDSRVTFPFLEIQENTNESEDNKVLDFLMSIDWDFLVKAGMGNRYFVDIPAVIDRVYLDLNIDKVSEGLNFTGKLNDESLRIEGGVESTRGRVDYLDMSFRVDRFGAVFNRYEIYPEVYGRAYTTVRDSTNFPRDIYLVLYTIDPETNQEVAGGRWEDFRFKLVSSDPTIGETQESVLAYLGYSVNNISGKASDVGLTLTENYLIRPLVRPLERKLERSLQLDYVRFRSHFTSNIINYGFHNRLKIFQEANYNYQNMNYSIDPALLLLQSSEITLGKYLMSGIYLTYSGQIVAIYDEPKLGLNHRFGIEYRLLRNLLLELEYDKLQFDPRYYSRDALNDFRIRLRHSFNF